MLSKLWHVYHKRYMTSKHVVLKMMAETTFENCPEREESEHTKVLNTQISHVQTAEACQMTKNNYRYNLDWTHSFANIQMR